jgi:hypothetical protein
VVRVLQQRSSCGLVCSIVRSITGVIFEGVPHLTGVIVREELPLSCQLQGRVDLPSCLSRSERTSSLTGKALSDSPACVCCYLQMSAEAQVRAKS